MVKTRRQPSRVVESAGFESNPIGSSGGSGDWMNLDSPSNKVLNIIKVPGSERGMHVETTAMHEEKQREFLGQVDKSKD